MIRLFTHNGGNRLTTKGVGDLLFFSIRTYFWIYFLVLKSTSRNSRQTAILGTTSYSTFWPVVQQGP